MVYKLIQLFSLTIFLQLSSIAQPDSIKLEHEGKLYSLAGTSIPNILTYTDSIFDKAMDDTSCISAAGVFSFQIDTKGSVIMLGHEGTLPDNLVTLIKKNIEKTSGHWQVFSSSKEKSQSKPIYLAVSLDVEIDKNRHKCRNLDTNRSRLRSFDASLVTLLQRMSNTYLCRDKVLETEFMYILTPALIYYAY
jgi:hypothetical protein